MRGFETSNLLNMPVRDRTRRKRYRLGKPRINGWRGRFRDQSLSLALIVALGRGEEVFQEKTRSFAPDESDPVRHGLKTRAALGARHALGRPPVEARTGRRVSPVII